MILTLVDYFFDKSTNPKASRENTKEIATQLLDKYNAELLFFAIRWCAKYYPYSFTSLDFVEQHIDLISIRFETMEVKKRLERRRSEYDRTNAPKEKRVDWLSRGIDQELFKD